MLLEFSVSNWLSFKDKVTFSMLAGASNVLDENYVLKGKHRILKAAAIYGANASGKTNLFEILTNVILMLKKSNHVDINSNLPIIPFKFDKNNLNKVSEFEIKFIVNNVEYVYGFAANYKAIYEEYLYYYPNGKETKIFYRHHTDKYDFTTREEKFLKDIVPKNSANKFFLATATNWNYEKTKPAYDFLTQSLGVCFGIEELKKHALQMYASDKDGSLKKFALEFLKAADFNIIDYEVTKVDIPEKIIAGMTDVVNIKLLEKIKAYQVIFKHKGDIKLDLTEESLGTQMIFSLIPYIVDTLNRQKVLIVDELDRSLHPFLVQYIVQMFNNSDVNKNGAQFIFNTHDTNLLNLNILRRDQIWFTEKNNETGESNLYPLSDFSVRKKENVEKGYILGRYGAVPFITNDIIMAPTSIK